MPIPAAGKAVKAGKKGIKKLADALKDVKKPRREAITAVDLRKMSPDEAMEIARSERHIIPQMAPAGMGHNGGPPLEPEITGYVGAPAKIKSRADIDKMRSDYDEAVAGGQGGADWYIRTHAGVKEMAGPDPKKQHLLAQELGVTSPQSNPDTNLGFAIGGHNAYEMGHPIRTQMKTGQSARTYTEGRTPDGTADLKLGKKTGPFAGHLDPTMESPTTPANDIWQARSFGYEGRMDPKQNDRNLPFNRALTPQEHSFLDAEALLAVDRANKKALGGRTDWTVGEIQASPWVRNKANSLMERYGLSDEQALKEAAKTYPDYFDKYTGHETYEMTPGSLTGHHTDMIGSGEHFTPWMDDDGRDIIYSALGAHQRPTLEAQGVYQAPGGELELNQAWAARPMISFQEDEGGKVVEDSSRAMMNIAAANRAYFSGQNAGAWSKPIPGGKKGRQNAVFFDQDESMSPEAIGNIKELFGNRFNMPDVVDYGNKAAITGFYPSEPDPKALAKAMRSGEVDEMLNHYAPSRGEAQTGFMDSGYVGFEDAYSSGQPGAVTQEFMNTLDAQMSPVALEKLEKDPAFKAKVMDLYSQSIEREAMSFGDSKGNPLLRNAMEIFNAEGYQGLRDAISKGIVPATALVPLAQALSEGDRSGM
jgi:hypothetical protein